jgi:integrase/recombinase XerD
MLLRSAIDLFLDGYFSTCERSPKTVAAYTSDLRQFLRGQPARRNLETFTPEQLEDWGLELKRRHLAPASMRRKFAVLRVFFNYWVRKRVLDRSPLWNLRLDFGRQRTLTRTIGADEMRLLLDRARADLGALPAEPNGSLDRAFLALRNWAVLELLFTTGMRVGEAAALRLGDLRLEERSLLVRGKGGRQRLAFLPDYLASSPVRPWPRGWSRWRREAETPGLL